jgi:hypothetical protein
VRNANYVIFEISNFLRKSYGYFFRVLPLITAWIIPTREGLLYLAVVMDLCMRMIVGWSMDGRMTREVVRDALRMRRFRRKPAPGAAPFRSRQPSLMRSLVSGKHSQAHFPSEAGCPCTLLFLLLARIGLVLGCEEPSTSE